MAARGDVDFLGILGEYVTFDGVITHDSTFAGGSDLAEKPVTIGANGVDSITDGAFVLGKLILVEDDERANVQVKGFMKFDYTGVTSAVLGRGIVGAASNQVRAANSAVPAELLIAQGKIVKVLSNAVWVLF